MTDRAAVEVEALFRATYPGLVRALTAAHGERAADAVQDAFAQAHHRWSRIRTYDEPALWVRRVAVNNLLNARRAAKRRDRAVARLSAPVPVEPQADRLDLVAALRRLPPQQRTAIALHYLADLDVATVAATMGLAEGTAKSHLSDARHNLRRYLEVPEDA